MRKESRIRISAFQVVVMISGVLLLYSVFYLAKNKKGAQAQNLTDYLNYAIINTEHQNLSLMSERDLVMENEREEYDSDVEQALDRAYSEAFEFHDAVLEEQHQQEETNPTDQVN